MSDAKDKPADHSPATAWKPTDLGPWSMCSEQGKDGLKIWIDEDLDDSASLVVCALEDYNEEAMRYRAKLLLAAPALLKALRGLFDLNDARSKRLVDDRSWDEARKALALVDGEVAEVTPSKKQKPTIAELEAILSGDKKPRIVVLPSGELSTEVDGDG